MSLVWDNFSRGGSEKLAMLALADWCDDHGGNLYPAISNVAKKINTSEVQARRIIHKFIADGYLSVVGNANGGAPGKSRRYVLNVQMLKDTPLTSDTPITNATPITHDSPTPLTGDTPKQPLPLSPVIPLPLSPVIVTPLMGESLTISEPSVNLKSTTTPNDDLFPGVSDQVISDFKKMRQIQKAAITKTAMDGIKREAKKAGVTLETALTLCCESNWRSFKAEWVNKTPPSKAMPVKTPAPDNFSNRDYGHGGRL